MPLDSEHPLYVLYTSGTTGKPKGILHTTGGYLTQITATMKWVFDLRDEDTYWCSADIGWVTGHSYIVYGPLSAGATTVMYEGALDFPQFDRWWRIIEKYRVNIFYTSPTAIRALHPPGRAMARRARSIQPAPARFGGRAHQSRGVGMVSPRHRQGALPHRRYLVADRNRRHHDRAHAGRGAAQARLGNAAACPESLPISWISTAIEVGPDREGFLIIRRPWPGMIRTIWGDPERYKEQYWSRVPGVYFTGDAARRDDDGYYWVLGRVDDVMNVSGHRLSTMEVESALVQHPAVAEAAVVGKPHEITGQAVCCFVTLKKGEWDHEQLGKELRQWVAHEIGSFARPEEIRFTDALPKTRSGKIMRRLLREIVTGNTVAGDVTTLEDLGVVTKLAAQHDED